jgi:hypothetical protein
MLESDVAALAILATLILNVAGAVLVIMVIGRRVETYCFGDRRRSMLRLHQYLHRTSDDGSGSVESAR